MSNKFFKYQNRTMEKQIIPFTTSKASGLIVSVPEGLKIDIGYINDEYAKGQYIYGSASGLPIADWHEPLPPGNWHFLGLSHELTEQEKEQIVEMEAENVMIDWDIEEGDIMGNVYRDYEGFRFFYKPSKSFDSLLLSLGLDPKENLAILINDKK